MKIKELIEFKESKKTAPIYKYALDSPVEEYDYSNLKNKGKFYELSDKKEDDRK